MLTPTPPFWPGPTATGGTPPLEAPPLVCTVMGPFGAGPADTGGTPPLIAPPLVCTVPGVTSRHVPLPRAPKYARQSASARPVRPMAPKSNGHIAATTSTPRRSSHPLRVFTVSTLRGPAVAVFASAHLGDLAPPIRRHFSRCCSRASAWRFRQRRIVPGEVWEWPSLRWAGRGYNWAVSVEFVEIRLQVWSAGVRPNAAGE